MPLTAKQQRFVDEYLIDANATQAAIRAGYSPATAKEIGYENLTKPHIAAAVAEGQQSLQRATIADATERREGLSTLFRTEENPMARIKAVDILNKMDGFYGQNQGVTVHVPGAILFAIVKAPNADCRD